MKPLSSLSIFFPSLNDAKALPELVKKAYAIGQIVAQTLEVIVVNDGSTDNTKDVLVTLQHTYKNLRIITHAKNHGYGGALISGFTAAKYEWVFYTDGDGQYNPLELSRLVKEVKTSIDVVNGYKIKRADPLIRVILGNAYNWLMHQKNTLPIKDIDCDFRLIRNSMLKKIHLTETSGAICMELITKLQAAGAQFTDVGVSHYPRLHGHSQFFTFKHLHKTFLSFFR